MDRVQPLPPNGKSVLLVVDDYPENLVTMRAVLQRQDWEIVTASSGMEALGLLLDVDVDLVLLDVQMPEMDGLEATKQLRATGDTSNVPIIALTALAMPGDRERCLAAGANYYLAKPVNLKNLVMTINQIIQKAAND